MSQPTWKLLHATDEQAVYTDETGVYEPQLSVLCEYDTGRGTQRYYVHRLDLERYKIVRETESDVTTRYLVPIGYEENWPHHASQYVPWFYKNLESIASSAGTTKIAIIRALCSASPNELAFAYGYIGGHWGWDNFDSYPIALTESAVANWPELDGKPEIRISTNDDDDGQVTLYCTDVEACRDAQSILGTRWQGFKDGEAYAKISDRVDLVTALEKEGFEVDDSEWSPPEAEDFAYWSAKYERANGASPERLREILGWRTLADLTECRRVQEGPRSWWTDEERSAYQRACFDAGVPLDAEKWLDERTDSAEQAHRAFAEDAEKIGRP